MRFSSNCLASSLTVLTTALTVLLPTPRATAALFFWRVDTTDRAWSNHNNWSGPTGEYPHSNVDTVYVQGVTGFDPDLDFTLQIGQLIVRLGGDACNGNGTSNHLLVVTSVGGNIGRTQILDEGSSLTIYRSTNMNDFDTDDLSIGSGAALKLRGGAVVQIDDKLNVGAGAQIDGAGSIELSRVDGTNDPLNDGFIWAFGGTLTFFGHPDIVFDLDGLSENGALEANDNSTLTFDLAVETDFNGAMHIDPNAEIRINDLWSLASEVGSTLTFRGGAGRATLAGTGATLRGAVAVTSGEAWLEAPIVFGSEVGVTLATGTTMHVDSFAVVDQGATFGGAGQVVVSDGAQIDLGPGANIGVAVRNDGVLSIGDQGPAAATIASFVQGPAGRYAFTACGQSDGGTHDQLTVTGTATLAGALDIVLGVCELTPGEELRIITAGSVVGTFTEVAGLENVEVVYTETTVTLVVTDACPADLDGDGAVGFFEVLAILAAWGNVGGPEDIDGDGTVGFGDVLTVLAIWGPCGGSGAAS